MARYKRARYLVLTFEDLAVGESGETKSFLVLTSILTGEHIVANRDELESLQSVPTDDWVDPARLGQLGLSPERILQWTELGILIADNESEYSKALRGREELLQSSH